MRYFLSLVCVFVFSLAGLAQSAKTAFVTDAEVAWLDKEVKELKESLNKMQQAVDAEDRNLIAANKTAIIKAVNRLSTNCNTTVVKIDTEINPPTKNAVRDLDTPPDYYYNKKKAVEALQELKLTDNNIAVLSANAAKLRELRDKLTENEFYFHPKYPVAKDNLSMVYEMLKLAESSNSVLQRSVVAD